MAFYLIGSQGRLGQALCRTYENEGIFPLLREQYSNWGVENAKNQVTEFFEKNANPGDVIFVASGVLNPAVSEKTLRSVNFNLPKNVIDGALDAGLKVITFGTIMETTEGLVNPYISSKRDLAEYVESKISNCGDVIHIRIHTLYGGGAPSPFMFLGQIGESLIGDTIFNMTSGRQLREYHHVDDDASAIRKLNLHNSSGLIDLNHGNALPLKSIAEYLFSAFNKSHLLNIGALLEPEAEKYMQLPALNFDNEFRDSLPAIVEYMKEYCV